MKKMLIGLLVLSSVSAFANDVGAKLKSCTFDFASIEYSAVDLGGVELDAGLYLYTSITKQVILGVELPANEIPAIVKSKKNKVIISYPIMNDQGEIETNQFITVSTRKVVEANGSEIVLKAIMNTLGWEDEGICRFSL